MDLWSIELYNALLVFSLLNIVDIITTYNVVRKLSPDAELNPLARFMFKRLGVKGMFVIKYIGCGLLLLYGYIAGVLIDTIWIWNIVLGAVVAWNSYVNHKLRRDSR
jgi:hypothetical protein